MKDAITKIGMRHLTFSDVTVEVIREHTGFLSERLEALKRKRRPTGPSPNNIQTALFSDPKVRQAAMGIYNIVTNIFGRPTILLRRQNIDDVCFLAATALSTTATAVRQRFGWRKKVSVEPDKLREKQEEVRRALHLAREIRRSKIAQIIKKPPNDRYVRFGAPSIEAEYPEPKNTDVIIMPEYLDDGIIGGHQLCISVNGEREIPYPFSSSQYFVTIRK